MKYLKLALAAAALALSTGATAQTKPPSGGKLTRWEQYSQALLSANEFFYID